MVVEANGIKMHDVKPQSQAIQAFEGDGMGRGKDIEIRIVKIQNHHGIQKKISCNFRSFWYLS